MGEKIMLLDGNSLINRAFYGIPVLTNKAGEFTNAVFGFINIFQKLYNEESPSRVAVAFDLPAPTFRHKLYSEYKGTRKAMPQELRPQIGTLKALLRLMNIPVVELEGFEADDILGSLSLSAEKAGFDVTLVSGDKDLLQIASDKTKIRIPKTKAGKTEVEDYYAADLFAELGLTTAEYIELKALMGDSSDNIPGVPGIGEKTALKIISEYKNVEVAIENAGKITPKRASENLVTYAEQARLSRILAEINRNAPVPPLPEPIAKNEIFNAAARDEILRLEFRSLLPLFEQKAEVKASAPRNYRTITTKNGLDEYLAELSASKQTAFRLVCDGGRLLGVAFCTDKENAVFATAFGELGEDELLSALKPFFEGEAEKICYDLKGELTFLAERGISLANAAFDVMLAAYILDASASLDYSAVAYDYLGEAMQSPEEFFGKGKNRTEITAISNDGARLEKFACGQAYTVFAAHEVMARRIEENHQHELYYGIELPLVYVLRDMERFGIKIDRQAIAAFGNRLDAMLSSLTNEIYMLAGEEFNIASPKQLGVILFEKLGLKSGKKTKTGYSTSADVLNELTGKHPVVGLILEHRTYSKLKSTYVDGLLAVAKTDDDKIYSTFNQLVTATGRISSTEPNLQNIPIRYELGRELRKVFIPSSEDYVFLDADYSQIELRILAHLSGDETFVNAFRNGEDIHRLTASQVFGLPLEFVSPEQRSNAKAVNFGIVYGISAFSLSQDLSISVKEAQRYIDGYFERYPGVRAYLDEIINSAKNKGYAETLFHRRRGIPELKSSNFAQRAFGERAAMNMPVQGTAADIIKIAMVGVSRRLKAEGLKSRLILQVHDELLVEAHRDEIERVTEILKTEMEGAAKLLVPIDAEVKRGNSWFEAH